MCIRDRNKQTIDLVEDNSVVSASYDAGTTTLTLSKGDTTSIPIDLSSLLDDTNLARITSASIDVSDVLTLTRDDNTTLTVDISQLNDSATITQEVADRIAADAVLQTQITTNTNDIAQETTDRIGVDNGLQAQIDTNDMDIAAINTAQSIQDAAITDNASDLSQEILDRIAADMVQDAITDLHYNCLLYTSPSPRDRTRSRMPSSA